jgi:MYXO-CTERM domain-containing protein
MNCSSLSKILGVSLLILGLAVPTTLPASAQTSSSGTSTTVDNSGSAADTDRNYSDGDWGLLGLLGLFGLFGRRSQKDVPTAYEDPNVATTRTIDR